MEDILTILLVAVIAFGGVVMFGGITDSDSWENDCKLLQQHRANNSAYECRKITHEQK